MNRKNNLFDFGLLLSGLVSITSSCSHEADALFEEKGAESAFFFQAPKIIKPIRTIFNQRRYYSGHKKNLALLRNHDHRMLQKDLHQFIKIRSDYYQKFNTPPMGGIAHVAGWKQINEDKEFTYPHITYARENFSPFLKLIYNNFVKIELEINSKFSNRTAKEYIISKYIIHFRLAEKIRELADLTTNELSTDEKRILKEAEYFSLSPNNQFPMLFLSSNIYTIELMDRYHTNPLATAKDFDFNKINDLINNTIQELSIYEFMKYLN